MSKNHFSWEQDDRFGFDNNDSFGAPKSRKPKQKSHSPSLQHSEGHRKKMKPTSKSKYRLDKTYWGEDE